MSFLGRRLRRVARSGPARQMVVYFASSSLRSGITFLLLPLLATLLGPEGFGLWSLFRTLLLFLTPVMGLSIHAAIGRNFHHLSPEQLRRLVYTCVLFIAVAALVVLLGAAPWLLTHDKLFSVPTHWLLLAPVIALLANITMINQSLLRQQQRPWSFAAYELTGGVLPFLAGLMLIWWGLDWTALVLGLLGANTLTAIASLWRFHHERQAGGPIDRPLLRATMKFTLPLIPHTLGMAMLVLSDRLVLEHYTTPAEVGIYSVGYILATALQLLSLPFANAWSPWAYRQLAGGEAAGRLRLVQAFYAYGAVMSLVALGWWLVSPLVLRWFFAPEFQVAAPVIGWVLVGLVFAALHSALFAVLSDAGRSGAICVATVVAVAVNLAGCILLVPVHGMLGAAWATAAAYAILFAGLLILTQRLSPLPWLAGLRSVFRRRRPTAAP